MRILIVNPFGIGDVLFSTPLIRAVREAFPKSFIGYLCNRRTEPILKTNPHINAVFVYEKDEFLSQWRGSKRQGLRYLTALLIHIRRARFDWVIDLSLGERYSMILRWLHIPRRMGFNYRRRGRFLTEALPIRGYQDVHVVTYYRQLLEFMGVQPSREALELHRDDVDQAWAEQWLKDHHIDAEQCVIGMVPAGGVSWGIDAPFRRWSCEGFAVVGDELVKRYDANILLFGETADAHTCQAVARLMKSPATNLAGQTTLGQFISLMARLHLVVCNDGGPLHIAVSQGVDTVSIFGPVDPHVYGPYADSGRHQVVCRAELPCRPCYHQFKLPPCPYERACLTTIEPQQVIEACVQLLGPSSARAVGWIQS